MKLLRTRTATALLGLTAVASCTDRDPILPPPAAGPGEVRCEVDVAAGTVSCAPPPAGTPGAGRQAYARLVSAEVAYDAAAGVAAFDVYLLNLLPRLLGTPDGATLTGIRVFVDSAWATRGTGAVAVADADGTAPVGGAPTPYFDYPEVLEPGTTSSVRTWRFSIPAGVTRFEFSAFVETETHDGSWTPPEPPPPVTAPDLFWRTVAGGVLPPQGTLRDVWAASPGDVWTVGDAGGRPVLLHRGNGDWALQEFPGREAAGTLSGVWGMDAANVYAVGGGRVLRYDGSAWARVQDLPVTLNGVGGTSGGVVFAVGHGVRDGNGRPAVIVRLSANGTQAGTTEMLGGGSDTYTSSATFHAVDAEGSTVVAVGEFVHEVLGASGVTVRSTDGGATWTVTRMGQVTGFPQRAFHGVDVSGSTVYVVGTQRAASGTEGVILRSADGGATWSETVSAGPTYSGPTGPATSRVLRDVRILASGEVLVFGSQVNAGGRDEALVLRSSGGGAAWTAESPGASPYPLHAGTAAVGDVWAVGELNSILRRSGGTWTVENEFLGERELMGVWMDATGRAVAVGTEVDGGRTHGWVRRWDGAGWSSARVMGPGGRSLLLTGVAGAGSRAVASGYGSVSGGLTEGAVLVSGDGGATWSTFTSPASVAGSQRYLHAAAAASPQMLFAAGYEHRHRQTDGVVLRSTDGGASWVPSVLPGPSHACGTDCTARERSLHGIAAAGGQVYAAGHQVNAAGGVEALVLRSTDGGASWSPHVSAPPTGRARRLYGVWTSGDTAVAVGTEGTVNANEFGITLRTVDGGATWTRVEVRSVRPLRGVWGAPGGIVYAAGDGGSLVSSGDAGLNWRVESSGTVRHLRGVSGSSALDVIAVGEGGAIVRGSP